MTNTRFIPFGLEDDSVEEFFALTEELSDATLKLLRDWIIETYGDRGMISGRALVSYASQARIDLRISTQERVVADTLKYHFPWTKDLLGFIHFALYDRQDLQDMQVLDEILIRGHAAWTVDFKDDGGPSRIVRRLPEGVAEAVRDVASRSDKAGQLLTKAWNNAYGFDNDASVAYSRAIKAVETLACPLIEEARAKPTLGTTYRALRDQHRGKKTKWTFLIDNPDDSEHSVQTVVSMMETLWHGQMDRHGGDEYKTRSVTNEEARAAVLLAATLVGWLNDGYLVKS